MCEQSQIPEGASDGRQAAGGDGAPAVCPAVAVQMETRDGEAGSGHAADRDDADQDKVGCNSTGVVDAIES